MSELKKHLENEIIKMKKKRYNATNPVERVLAGAKLYELTRLLKQNSND